MNETLVGMMLENDYSDDYRIAVEGALDYQEEIEGVTSWYRKKDEANKEEYTIIIDATENDRIRLHVKNVAYDAIIGVSDSNRKDCIEQLVKLANDPKSVPLDIYNCMHTLIKCHNFATRVFERTEAIKEIYDYMESFHIKENQVALLFLDGNPSLFEVEDCFGWLMHICGIEGIYNYAINSDYLDDPDKIRISMWY